MTEWYGFSNNQERSSSVKDVLNEFKRFLCDVELLKWKLSGKSSKLVFLEF